MIMKLTNEEHASLTRSIDTAKKAMNEACDIMATHCFEERLESELDRFLCEARDVVENAHWTFSILSKRLIKAGQEEAAGI